jgi:bis(5'-nucleosyl)-tetraphosphatase (symmetrical)
MAVYAIGDIQGCYDELLELLETLHFDRKHDRLWFVGDLVNRGPKSLETLRFVQGLGPAAVTVLGNHDLHLLAAAHGIRPDTIDDDTLDPILTAPDREVLIDWLRRVPLLHYDGELGYLMVHAGLPPQWDLKLAQRCADEVETVLRGDRLESFLSRMYGNKPRQWSEQLDGWDRLRFIVNCFTRMRFCDRNGRLELKSSGPPGSQPEGYYPWFEIPARASGDINIIFGHWSTLRALDIPGVYPIDSGCLWGGQLTALRIDSRPERIDLPCPGWLKPRSRRPKRPAPAE